MAKEKSDDGKCEQERKPTDPDNDETIAYEQVGDHSNHSNKENDELEHEKSRTSKKIVDNSKTGTHLKTTTKKTKDLQEMHRHCCCKKRTKQKEIFLRKQMEEEAFKQEAVIIQLQQENTKKADDINPFGAEFV